MFKCLRCNFAEEYERDIVSIGCSMCSEIKKQNTFNVIDTVFIRDYGNVEVSRINEMKRRVIIPKDNKDGSYYVGRRGENGKIQEREPSA